MGKKCCWTKRQLAKIRKTRKKEAKKKRFRLSRKKIMQGRAVNQMLDGTRNGDAHIGFIEIDEITEDKDYEDA